LRKKRTLFEKTVEGWTEVLRDKTGDADWRCQAVWTLGCFGAEAKSAVPDLIEALGNEWLEKPLNEFRNYPDPLIQMWASEALARVIPKDGFMTTPSPPTKSVPAAGPPRDEAGQSRCRGL
jgi:hypothetical protein